MHEPSVRTDTGLPDENASASLASARAVASTTIIVP